MTATSIENGKLEDMPQPLLVELLKKQLVVQKKLKEKLNDCQTIKDDLAKAYETTTRLSQRNEYLEKTVIALEKSGETVNRSGDTVAAKEISDHGTDDSQSDGHLDDVIDSGSEARRRNMLELELKDFRKLVSELNEQLNHEKTESEARRKLLESTDLRYGKLLHDLEMLDCEKSRIQEHSDSLRVELDQLKTEMTNTQQSLSAEHSRYVDLQDQFASLDMEMGKVKIELSRSVATSETEVSDFVQQLQESRCKTLQLQAVIDRKDTESKTMQERIDVIQDEFTVYKERAADALKRKQAFDVETGSDVGGYALLDQKLKKCKKDFNFALLAKENMEKEMLQFQKVNRQLEVEMLTMDARHQVKLDQLQSHYDQLEADFESSKSLSTLNLHKYAHVNMELRSLNQELMLSSEKFQAELTAKDQEINKLKCNLEDTKVELDQKTVDIERLNCKLDLLKSDYLSDRKVSPTMGTTDQNSKSTKRVANLDAILNGNNATEHSGYLFDEEDSANRNFGKVEWQRDCHFANEQLVALKEELRRYERNEQRCRSVTNMEYLKNIVIKFIMSDGDDERLNLLPVITQMLVLSENEVENLKQRTIGSARVSWFGGIFG